MIMTAQPRSLQRASGTVLSPTLLATFAIQLAPSDMQSLGLTTGAAGTQQAAGAIQSLLQAHVSSNSPVVAALLQSLSTSVGRSVTLATVAAAPASAGATSSSAPAAAPTTDNNAVTTLLAAVIALSVIIPFVAVGGGALYVRLLLGRNRVAATAEVQQAHDVLFKQMASDTTAIIERTTARLEHSEEILALKMGDSDGVQRLALRMDEGEAAMTHAIISSSSSLKNLIDEHRAEVMASMCTIKTEVDRIGQAALPSSQPSADGTLEAIMAAVTTQLDPRLGAVDGRLEQLSIAVADVQQALKQPYAFQVTAPPMTFQVKDAPGAADQPIPRPATAADGGALIEQARADESATGAKRGVDDDGDDGADGVEGGNDADVSATINADVAIDAAVEAAATAVVVHEQVAPVAGLGVPTSPAPASGSSPSALDPVPIPVPLTVQVREVEVQTEATLGGAFGVSMPGGSGFVASPSAAAGAGDWMHPTARSGSVRMPRSLPTRGAIITAADYASAPLATPSFGISTINFNALNTNNNYKNISTAGGWSTAADSRPSTTVGARSIGSSSRPMTGTAGFGAAGGNASMQAVLSLTGAVGDSKGPDVDGGYNAYGRVDVGDGNVDAYDGEAFEAYDEQRRDQQHHDAVSLDLNPVVSPAKLALAALHREVSFSSSSSSSPHAHSLSSPSFRSSPRVHSSADHELATGRSSYGSSEVAGDPASSRTYDRAYGNLLAGAPLATATATSTVLVSPRPPSQGRLGPSNHSGGHGRHLQQVSARAAAADGFHQHLHEQQQQQQARRMSISLADPSSGRRASVVIAVAMDPDGDHDRDTADGHPSYRHEVQLPGDTGTGHVLGFANSAHDHDHHHGHHHTKRRSITLVDPYKAALVAAAALAAPRPRPVSPASKSMHMSPQQQTHPKSRSTGTTHTTSGSNNNASMPGLSLQSLTSPTTAVDAISQRVAVESGRRVSASGAVA